MARLSALALVMFELLCPLQSMRMNRGVAHEPQSSGHSEHGDMTVGAYNGELLACKYSETDSWEERIIILAKDKSFVEYDRALDNMRYAESSPPINCKTFAMPPKPSSMLRNLPDHTLSEDVIGLIATSFSHDLDCTWCRLYNFTMSFLERCRAALIQNQWMKVDGEVEEEGGSCEPTMTSKKGTLQTCMASPNANQVAVCRLQSAANDLQLINLREVRIKEHEVAVEAHQQDINDLHVAIERNVAENKDAMEVHQRGVDKKINNQGLMHISWEINHLQSRIRGRKLMIKELQHSLDARKQNSAYLKQIFEGL